MIKSAFPYYGYVLSAVAVENDDGDSVTQVKMWTSDGEKTVLTPETYSVPEDSNYNIKSRDVIEYKLNTDGELSEVVAYYTVDSSAYTSVSAATTAGNGENGYATVGITNWGATAQFQALADGQTYTDGNNRTDDGSDNYFEADSDTEYIYIDNSKPEGFTSGTVDIADDSGDEDAPTGALVPNAFVVFDDEGTLVLVVYDTDNDIIR